MEGAREGPVSRGAEGGIVGAGRGARGLGVERGPCVAPAQPAGPARALLSAREPVGEAEHRFFQV